MEKEIIIKDLIEKCNAKLIQGDENLIFTNLSKDTREIKPGQIYIGIQGENFNGSTLYEQALEKGAKACLLQNVEINPNVLRKYPNATIVLVENTVKTLQQMAAYKRSLYNIPIVAITGSVGKTSTKDMVASVLSQKYKVLKTKGNYNNEIGLPLTILSLEDEEAMVLEMGMNSFGEISLLTNIAKPDVAIITNIGTAHIGLLGSRENILKAKLEILEGLKSGGTFVINHDNDMLKQWYDTQKTSYQIVTYGITEKSDVMASDIQLSEEGSDYQLQIKDKNYSVHVPVGGEHFVYNSLCAISVASIFDIPIEKALMGISNFDLTKRRMEMKTSKIGATVINDCYNANYDSMKAAIDYLGKLPNTKKIAVLGSMLELGDYSRELHEKVGVAVVENKIDLLICVGEEALPIATKAEEEGMNPQFIFYCSSKEEAIAILKQQLKPEDAVLIKASNSLNFIDICNAICE